jgi:hypothetical protein
VPLHETRSPIGSLRIPAQSRKLLPVGMLPSSDVTLQISILSDIGGFRHRPFQQLDLSGGHFGVKGSRLDFNFKRLSGTVGAKSNLQGIRRICSSVLLGLPRQKRRYSFSVWWHTIPV